MNIDISGDIFPLIFLLIVFLYGIIATFFPFYVAKTFAWPKALMSKTLKEEVLSSKTRDAINLIDDAEAYQEQFGSQLLIIRITGGFILSLFCCMVAWVITKL